MNMAKGYERAGAYMASEACLSFLVYIYIFLRAGRGTAGYKQGRTWPQRAEPRQQRNSSAIKTNVYDSDIVLLCAMLLSLRVLCSIDKAFFYV